MAKPKPVAKSIVCSECGLPWDKHTEGRKTDPTPDVCISLLKAALATRPLTSLGIATSPNTIGPVRIQSNIWGPNAQIATLQ